MEVNEIKVKRGLLGEDVLSHEAYGMASFSRISTNRSEPLFGSSIGHSQLIRLRIQKGEQYRSDSSYDRYGARESIVEVETEPEIFEYLFVFSWFRFGNAVYYSAISFSQVVLGKIIKILQSRKDDQANYETKYESPFPPYEKRQKA